MRQLTAGVALVVPLGLGGTRPTASDRTHWDELIVADGPRAAAERQALSQALRLLPRMPARVAVIDSEAAKPEVKATLLRLDAFIVNGSTVVYVVRQSALLCGAAQAEGSIPSRWQRCYGMRWGLGRNVSGGSV